MTEKTEQEQAIIDAANKFVECQIPDAQKYGFQLHDAVKAYQQSMKITRKLRSVMSTKTMMQIYKEMGVNRLASVKPVQPQTIKAHIDKYVKAKADHIDNGSQCERGAIGGCTACHFWSGAISALTELLAQHGYEDSHE